MIKISYIVPLYNKEKYIKECIDSILSDESHEYEIEVCVVDDGSTDDSLYIVKKYYSLNKKVKVSSFTQNKGKNAACNRGFSMITGDYVCLFGADDVVVPGRTKVLLAACLNSGKAVYGGYIAKNSDLSEEYYNHLPRRQNFYDVTMRNGLSGGCCIIPTRMLSEVFPIPEHLKFEDWWISYILIKNNLCNVISEYVTYYRLGVNNDCGFYGGDIYSNVEKDYLRHFDCLNEFARLSDNPYILKSIDFRRAFLGQETSKVLYFKPFDSYSIKIIFFKLFGARLFCFFKKIKN